MLTRVARMYHEEGLPQREIALRLSLSQSRVSRLLRRATEAGIVRTVVVPPAGCTPTSRTRCARPSGCARRSSSTATIARRARRGHRELSRQHGRRGRADRDRVLERDADGRGRRDAVAGRRRAPRRSTQLVGGVGERGRAVPGDRADRAAGRADRRAGRAAPRPRAVAQRDTARGARPAIPAVAGVMASCERLTLALVGHRRPGAVGAARAERERDLRRRGRPSARARRGRRHLLPLLRRARGRAGLRARRRACSASPPSCCSAIPRRIGVAGGARKFPAIRASLRGGWINVLITDTASARRLAEESPLMPAAFLPPR